MKNHEKFARAAMKQFGKKKTKEILEFLIENGEETMQELAKNSIEYVDRKYERITEKQLSNADWRATQYARPEGKDND